MLGPINAEEINRGYIKQRTSELERRERESTKNKLHS